MKVIEEVLARRIFDKFTLGSYLPIGGLFYDEITALKRLHGLILDFELQSAISSLMRPTAVDVIKTLKMVEDASKSPLSFAEKSNVLISEEGVPVYVNPTLIENTSADIDLAQRNYVIGGVNGFDFIQTNSDVNDFSTGDDNLLVLNVNGVPVYVNPTLNEFVQQK
jgi:hypothetical protein